MSTGSLHLPYLLVSCMAASHMLAGQEAWRRVIPQLNGKAVDTLRAMAVPAQIEYSGKSLKGYVFLWGHESKGGTGLVNLGVLIDNIEDTLPAPELDQFRGPDLSAAVVKSNTVIVSVLHGATTSSIRTRLVFDGVPLLPQEIVDKENGCFETNVRSDQQSKDEWKRFVRGMSLGFDKAQMDIGGRVLSHRLKVEFSGEGIEPLLGELLRFVGP